MKLDEIPVGPPAVWGRQGRFTKEEPARVFVDPQHLSSKGKRVLGVALAYLLKHGRYPYRHELAMITKMTTENIMFYEQELRQSGLNVSFKALED